MTRMLVRRHRHRIERVAAALLTKRKLSGRQIDKLAGRSIADVPDRMPSDVSSDRATGGRPITDQLGEL